LVTPSTPCNVPPGPAGASAVQAADPITAEAVLPLLRPFAEPGAAWIAGQPFEYRADCASTNAALKEMAEESLPGTTIATDDQTCGRGLLGRSWLSQPGLDLTFSVLLRPALEPARGHLLALATGVAVAQTLEREFGLAGHVSLKWPNDVLLDGKKVCGILLEASAGADHIAWAVAGIGLNVNSEPSRVLAALAPEQAAEWQGRPQPVSLKEHLGAAVLRAPLLAALLARLTWWWSALDRPGEVPSLLEEWRKRDALAGRPVEVFAGADRSELAAAGEAAGLGDEGQLLVRTGDGALVEVFAGDVSVSI
jgi:BirA family transcriptional regulator, biotin operon repressor / biotin---[acetyl-CoA-carboxylase] ligase